MAGGDRLASLGPNGWPWAVWACADRVPVGGSGPFPRCASPVQPICDRRTFVGVELPLWREFVGGMNACGKAARVSRRSLFMSTM